MDIKKSRSRFLNIIWGITGLTLGVNLYILPTTENLAIFMLLSIIQTLMFLLSGSGAFLMFIYEKENKILKIGYFMIFVTMAGAGLILIALITSSFINQTRPDQPYWVPSKINYY